MFEKLLWPHSIYCRIAPGFFVKKSVFLFIIIRLLLCIIQVGSKTGDADVAAVIWVSFPPPSCVVWKESYWLSKSTPLPYIFCQEIRLRLLFWCEMCNVWKRRNCMNKEELSTDGRSHRVVVKSWESRREAAATNIRHLNSFKHGFSSRSLLIYLNV